MRLIGIVTIILSMLASIPVAAYDDARVIVEIDDNPDNLQENFFVRVVGAANAPDNTESFASGKPAKMYTTLLLNEIPYKFRITESDSHVMINFSGNLRAQDGTPIAEEKINLTDYHTVG